MPAAKVAEKPRSTSAGRLKEAGHLRAGRCALSNQPTSVKAPAITLPLSGRAKSADRTRARSDRADKHAHCSPGVASAPSSAPSSAPTTARYGGRQKLALSHSSLHGRPAIGEEALVLQKDLKKMEEKLATAERERDWAMTALRQSESELQKLLSQKATGDADGSDVRLNHYRVLLELLNLRCRLLEQWIEEEASVMAAQEEGHAEALRRMEQQVQELATEVVEQQAAFQDQVSAMSAQQEKLEQQHCEDYSLWSEELLRGREKAAEEIAALREDLKRQESLWHQEWLKMQQEAFVQGINVPDPPGFLLQWLASEENPDLKQHENERGRAALLETIPEAATETEEEQAPTPSQAQTPSAQPTANEAASKSDGSSARSFPEVLGKDKACDSQGSSAPSPTSRSSRTSRTSSLCISVPEDLLKSLERASDKQQTSRAWARIGQFHQRQKCFEKARQAYQQAVSLDATQHGCLANLAQLEAHAGNVSTAKEMLAAALLLDPSNKNYISFSKWLANGSA